MVIVIISMILMIFFPVWSFDDQLGQSHRLFPLEYRTVQMEEKNSVLLPYSITAILAIASATLALIQVTKYRNRILQMKLGALNSLFIAGTIAAAVLFSNDLIEIYKGGAYGLGLWLPCVAMVSNFIANRFIRRDERLVRESDRLR